MRSTSQAVRTGDATPIDSLKVHAIVDGRAACNRSLLALFVGDNGPVTCGRCRTAEEIARTWPALRGSIQPDPCNVPQTTKKAARIIEHMMGEESNGTDDGQFRRRVAPPRRT